MYLLLQPHEGSSETGSQSGHEGVIEEFSHRDDRSAVSRATEDVLDKSVPFGLARNWRAHGTDTQSVGHRICERNCSFGHAYRTIGVASVEEIHRNNLPTLCPQAA